MPEVGQVYRDTYGDGTHGKNNGRTIRIEEVTSSRVRATVLTDSAGKPLGKARPTDVSVTTLRNGYKLVEAST